MRLGDLADRPRRWIAGRGPWARAGLAAVAGALLTAAQPPVSAPAALFLAMPLLVWLVDAAPSARAAAIVGWVAGFAHFVTALHWIGHAFLVDAERFAWAMPFAVTLLPAGFALYWAAAAALAHALWPGGTWTRAILLAAALAAAEAVRAHAFTGFPWGLAGYGWLDTALAQTAAWVGPFGLTLLTLGLAALPLVAGPRSPAAWGALGLLALLWAGGAARAPVEAADGPVLRIVQPNAPQHLKWHPDHAERFLRRLVDLTAAPPGPLGAPAAVIWPETAITFLPQDAPEAVRQLAGVARGAWLVTGALFYETGADGRRRWSNSLMAVSPEGAIAERYDKHHLVPFGEYMPARALLERLGLEALAGMNGAGFVPGRAARSLALPGLPPMAPAICYEMIFPAEVVPPGPRPDWILHATNDAWFGSFAGPQQHLAQARMRAIEQGLPVVRAANTGISAVIDARGRVLRALPLGEAGAIDAALPPPGAPTLYARTGDWPAFAAIAALLAGFALARPRARARAA